jgi:hypothetical protein
MEEWLPIKGLEGRYEVSNQGRVRSLDAFVRSVSKKGKEFLRPLKGRILAAADSKGYLLVNLPTAAGKHKVAKVHFLVAQAFVKGKGVNVNHKNGVKNDNYWENLEWSTPLEQQIHAVETGLRKQCIRVVGVRVSDGARFEFPSQASAAFAVTGYRSNSTNIRFCLRGERTQAFGYIWSRPE